MRMRLLFSLMLHLSFFVFIQGVANLRYYETLSKVGVTSRVTRSQNGARELIKHVNFWAFHRNFHLTLISGAPVLAEGFTAKLVHGDGSSSIFFIDQSKLFTGHLTDNPNVPVHANIVDNLWSIQILDENDMIAMEPAWRLLNASENPNNNTLIVYRSSDFVPDTELPFCGAKDPRKEQTNLHPILHLWNSSHSNKMLFPPHIRKEKRDAKDTCVLELIGDTDLFLRHCRKSYLACFSFMIAYMQTADTIFQKSPFEDSSFIQKTGSGLQVGALTLYTEYTIMDEGTKIRHYNEKNVDWDADSKLDSFSHYLSLSPKPYCLHHLFTSYPFPQRILGLAWMRTVCLTSEGGQTLNCGISSTIDIGSGEIPRMQGSLVFTHGHNFGSEHDPHTVECSHPDNEGGNYIMWDKAVTGIHPNHWKFSPCSLRQIGRQLEEGASCLLPRSKAVSFCGNGIAEADEQCDAGAFGITDADECCTKDCMLRTNAECSPVNQGCCVKCKMAQASVLCQVADDCKNDSYCIGDSYICPPPQPVEDWTSCADDGQCYRGECKSFCEVKAIKEEIALRPCMCESNATAACKWCCFDNSNPKDPGECLPYSTEILKNNRPCYLGYCKNGVCQIRTVSTVRRVYSYLRYIHTSELVKFMQTNIVLSVVLLSLVLWIPSGCFVYYIDCRERRQRELEDEKYLHEMIAAERRLSEMQRKIIESNKAQSLSSSGNDRNEDTGPLAETGESSSAEASMDSQ